MADKEYLDFEIEIEPGEGGEYPLSVDRSPAGEVRLTLKWPFTELELKSHLKDLQIALLRSSNVRRQTLAPEEKTIRDFGEALYEAIFDTEVRALYIASIHKATAEGKGLRLKLRVRPPELSYLPWEFLYDPSQGDYICMSSRRR